MSTPKLFTPITFRGMTSKNRIMMAPMCMFCGEGNGFANEFHYVHYVSRAQGQVGMIVMEAMAVEPEGRVKESDIGLWYDDVIPSIHKIVAECQKYGTKMGTQLNHSGAKSKAGEKSSGKANINEFSVDEIKRIIGLFKDAAIRAEAIGFDFIEIHGAHGYLINQFLSPVTNQRTDAYGEDRALFLKEVITEIREVWPEEKPLFVRVSAIDYSPIGNTAEKMVQLLEGVKDMVDLVHVSTGGVVQNYSYDPYPGYQVDASQEVRNGLGLPTAAVGLITEPFMAEEILRNGRADVVALGRPLLHDPYWPLHAAKQLHYDMEWVEPYQRSMEIYQKYVK